jgi:hypothetical protein
MNDDAGTISYRPNVLSEKEQRKILNATSRMKFLAATTGQLQFVFIAFDSNGMRYSESNRMPCNTG